MKPEGLYEGLIFPITENGVENYYITNAPVEVISECFDISYNKSEFISDIKEKGYKINRYRSGVSIDFDMK